MYVCVCACIISPFFRRKSNMFHFFCWPPREFRISELDPYEASLAGSTRGYSRTPRNGWKLSFIQLQLESALFSSDPSGSPDVLSPFSPVFESEDSRHQSDPQVHGKRSLHALRALLPEMLRKPEASEASEARKARKARGHWALDMRWLWWLGVWKWAIPAIPQQSKVF